MTITVKLFAIVREAAGRGSVSLTLPDEATIADAAEKLASDYPAVAKHLDRCAFALNTEYASPAEQLKDGDEVAVIPPVSGG